MLETVSLNDGGVSENNNSQTEKFLNRNQYINAINFANFEGEHLKVVFSHKVYARNLSVSALPSPCVNDSLEVTWTRNIHEEDLSRFECTKVLIPDRGSYLSAVPVDYCLTPEGMTFALPETARILNNRKTGRYPGKDIRLTLIQNGSIYEGSLIDFNPESLLFSLKDNGRNSLRWINQEDEFQVVLSTENETVFSGGCLLTSSRENQGTLLHTASILKNEIRRFRRKKFRGERFELASPVQISFIHPLSGTKCIIPVRDISGSGVSLIEEEAYSILIPGLIIPELNLCLPGGKPLKCRTQIIYRKKDEDSDRPKIVCGMAILDMLPEEHALLLNFIHQENDSHAFVCNPVDSTSLWKFFFESGFIYPEKYRHLSPKREKIKDLYDRLYTGSPGIARHFIYQEGNHIQGHMSMLRSYENSWLLHHHAASTVHSQNAGLHVLNQVGSFGNNCHRIRSLHMLYLMCYYREENKFPRRVFGDIARKINNPDACSLDVLAYYHFYRDAALPSSIPEGWTLGETTPGEIKDLKSCYRSISGGLMLKAMNLSSATPGNNSLYGEYASSGFNRKITLFSMRKEGECRGIIMADQSETGLNMSDLTNSLKVFIMDADDITRDIVDFFLKQVSGLFEEGDQIPVLMYPEACADELSIQKEKSYTLWVINMEASDTYFRYLKTLLKIIHH